MSKYIWCLLGGLCLAPSLSAQPIDEFGPDFAPSSSQGVASSASVITSDSEVYKVAILDFYLEDEGTSYLQVIIPNILQQRLSAIATHSVSETERTQQYEFLRENSIISLQNQLSQALMSRDTSQLREGASSAESAQDNINAIQDQLTALENHDATIDLNLTKQVEIARVETGESYNREALPTLARTQNADLVIGGTISVQDEFLLVYPLYYVRAEQKAYTADLALIAQDELPLLAVQLANLFAERIGGQEWGNVIIEGVRDNTEIRLNNKVMGYGNIELLYVGAGTALLEIVRESKEIITREIVITPQEETIVSFDIADSFQETIGITSTPSGAIVYLNGLWQGSTPLEVIVPTEEQVMVLKKEGYFDATQVIAPTTSNIAVTLQLQAFNTAEWLYSNRDTFYTSLTLFILSVPVPIIFYGIYENINNYQNSSSYNRLSGSERINVQNNAAIAQTVQYGGLFLSGVLLVNTIIELVRYVQAAELFHRL